MKKGWKRVLLGGLLVAAFCVVAGCGSDTKETVTLKGKVVKGPVVGAKVYDAVGVYFADTDATGSFPMTHIGPYRTTGGTYTPLDAQGNPGAPVAAPPMSAPAGVSQVTPLSTLVANAAPADQAKILNNLQSLGVSLNTDLSVKTANNAAALVLSESVGAMLQSAVANAGNNAAAVTAVTEVLVNAVANLPPSAVSTPTAANLAGALTTAVTTAAATNTDLAALSANLTTAASTAAQGAANAPIGALPVPTGSTGGTGGSGTTGLK